MERSELTALARQFMEQSPLARVSPEDALRPDLSGMAMFEPPLLGVAAAGDPAFLRLRDPEVVGPHVMLPEEWLPGAQSVVSFFFPFTGQVRRANARLREEPAPEWLHARIEGQAMLTAFGRFLAGELERRGVRAVAPVLDPRFWSRTRAKAPGQAEFTSNWSERHAAFVCGLGTFGLSRGLITEKGMAGRFFSLVTDCALEADVRAYSDPYAYCIRCGACARNCPAHAITLEGGKDQAVCSALVEATMARYRPRYGCGKCQVNVPCEARRPVGP